MQGMEKVRVAVKGMYKTIQSPDVWKPSLYMYLSLAVSISTHEGQFYWYTDPKAGPAFSQVCISTYNYSFFFLLLTLPSSLIVNYYFVQEFVGIIYAIGALASIVGVLIYHKQLKDYPFRNLLLFAQLLYASSGMLDLVFVLRWNLALGIPDYLFVIMEECVSRIVTKIRWMPMIVLSSRLCPLGIEGTFFALLMCIDSLGSLTAKWGGGMLLHLLNVTRTNFKNLWLTLLIRNLLRFATLSLIFLVPNVDHSTLKVSHDHHLVFTNNTSKDQSSSTDDETTIQLVPLNDKTHV